MLRGIAVAALACALAGCSLLFDFSDKAVPKDAMLDGPFTQDECDYKEPNDTIATAVMIDPAADVGPAAICPPSDGSGGDDHDFYKFTVPAMTAKFTVKVTLMNRPGGDLDLRLFDGTGSMVGQSRGFGNEEAITCPGVSPPCSVSAAGDYVFEVFPAQQGDVNEYGFAVALVAM